MYNDYADYSKLISELTDRTNNLLENKNRSPINKKILYYISLPIVLLIILIIWRPKLIVQNVVNKDGKKVTKINKLLLISIVLLLTFSIYYAMYKKGIISITDFKLIS